MTDKIYKLTALFLWPMYFNKDDYRTCTLYVGLQGVCVDETTIDEQGNINAVSRTVDFFSGLKPGDAEICKFLGISDATIQRMPQKGKTTFNAQGCYDAMKLAHDIADEINFHSLFRGYYTTMVAKIMPYLCVVKKNIFDPNFNPSTLTRDDFVLSDVKQEEAPFYEINLRVNSIDNNWHDFIKQRIELSSWHENPSVKVLWECLRETRAVSPRTLFTVWYALVHEGFSNAIKTYGVKYATLKGFYAQEEKEDYRTGEIQKRFPSIALLACCPSIPPCRFAERTIDGAKPGFGAGFVLKEDERNTKCIIRNEDGAAEVVPVLRAKYSLPVMLYTFHTTNILPLFNKFSPDRANLLGAFNALPTWNALATITEAPKGNADPFNTSYKYLDPAVAREACKSGDLKYTYVATRMVKDDLIAVLMIELLAKFASGETKELVDSWIKRGYVTRADVELARNTLVPQCLEESRKVDANILKAIPGTPYDKEGNPVSVCCDGTAITDTDVKYVFTPTQISKTMKGCSVRISYISERVKDAGAILTLPECGDINGKRVPIVSVVDDFLDEKDGRALRGVIFPKTLVQIGDGSSKKGVFLNCSGLEVLDFSACQSLKFIGENAFAGCSKLKDVRLPDIPAEKGYTIHKGAFEGLNNLGTLRIRALEILEGAFVESSIFDLDIDAVDVKGGAFKRTNIESTAKVGKSFKSIGPNGMYNLLSGQNINLDLPNIVTLGHGALYRENEGGTVNLGKSLTSIGSGALRGWSTATVNAEKATTLGLGAFAGLGSVTVHASSVYEPEACRSLGLDNVHYFEGETKSKYREDSEAYIEFCTAFLMEQPGSSKLCNYLEENLPKLVGGAAVGNPIIYDISEPLEDTAALLRSGIRLTDNQKAFFRTNDMQPKFRDDVVVADELAATRLDNLVVHVLEAIAKPLDGSLLSVYTTSPGYARVSTVFDKNKALVYSSSNMCVQSFNFQTIDGRMNAPIYLVELRNGSAYTYIGKSTNVAMVPVSSIMKDIGYVVPEDKLKADVEDDLYIPGRNWLMQAPSFGYTDEDDGSVISAPLLMPGDIVDPKGPTIMFESAPVTADALSGFTVTSKYLASIMMSSVLVANGNCYHIYNPFEKWYIAIDRSKEITRIRERETQVAESTYIDMIKASLGTAPLAIDDVKRYRKLEKTVMKPSYGKVTATPIANAVTSYEELVKNDKGAQTPFTYAFFKELSKDMAYLMGAHADEGVLSDANNLTPSKATPTRILMADGKWVQCFQSHRVTKAKALTDEDFIEGTKVAMRGGKYLYWYRIYDAKGSKVALDTFVSPFDIDKLTGHLGQYHIGESGGPTITVGAFSAKSNFVYNNEVMPNIAEGLSYESRYNIGSQLNKKTTEKIKTTLACVADAHTGKWYLVTDDAKIVGKKKLRMDTRGNVSNGINEYLVLFPIRNITFASALANGLSSARGMDETKAYLGELLSAISGGDVHSKIVEDYLAAVALLGADEKDTAKVAELTEFYLAPCLGY